MRQPEGQRQRQWHEALRSAQLWEHLRKRTSEIKAHQSGQRPVKSHLSPFCVQPIPPPDWQPSVSPCWAAPAPPKSIAKRSGHSDPTTDQQMHISVGSRCPTGHVPRKEPFQSTFTQHIAHGTTTATSGEQPTENIQLSPPLGIRDIVCKEQFPSISQPHPEEQAASVVIQLTSFYN